MKRFDYKIIPAAAALNEGLLRKLGSEGWQLKQVYTEAVTSIQKAILEKELPKDGME